MTKKQIAPYGSWKSPITSDLIVAETILLNQPMLDGDNIYWLEVRPQELSTGPAGASPWSTSTTAAARTMAAPIASG